MTRGHQDAQWLPVLRVDRGADPGQPSAAADPEAGGSGPQSPQIPPSVKLYALGRPALGAARATAAAIVAAGVLRISIGAAAFGAASNYNLLISLFRWFVGLSPDDPDLHPPRLPKNR